MVTEDIYYEAEVLFPLEQQPQLLEAGSFSGSTDLRPYSFTCLVTILCLLVLRD